MSKCKTGALKPIKRSMIIPIYGVEFIVSVADTLEESVRQTMTKLDELLEEGKFDYSNTSAVTRYSQKLGKICVCFTHKNLRNYSVVAHEMAHVVIIIFNWRGVEYGFNNEEHFCYLLQYLMQQYERMISR